MTTSPPTGTAITDRYSIRLFLALIAAGLAGNYFNFSIFLNIDFLFGSIFAMLALQFFGPGRGILAAAVIASYTYFLWNHPYAIIIMTAEVAVVGWLTGRRKMGLVLADALFWLIVGMPLVYFSYHLVMHVPLSNTCISMTKQALNGIANALAARLIFTGYALRSRSSLISYSEIVNNLLAFFVLCPALIMLAVVSRTDFNETDRQIRTTLIQDSKRAADRVQIWVVNRKSAILNLAEMAASGSPKQMQSYLEQAKKSDVNFLRIGLHDREATTTAYFPLIDELGHNNIGKNFADRSFIPMLKQTLKPMLSEVEMSRIGIPKPRVLVLAPVATGGAYEGFVAGILGLEQIREYLDMSAYHTAMLYTLIDKNGHVIMTNRTDQEVMTPFVRGKGALNRLDENGISQWVPVVTPNTPFSERWKNSFYVAEAAIGDLAEWKLILEQPVAPFQKKLYESYAGKLTLLFLILLGALALAELLSRKIVHTLERLRALTHELPVRMATGDKEILWPESGIKETKYLIVNFREMADSLSEQFSEIRLINESLERRVGERTTELRESEERHRIFFEQNQSVIIVIDSENGSIVDANPSACEYYGWSLEELTQKKIYDINTLSREEVASEIELAKQQTRNHFFFRHRRADGTIQDVEVYSGPVQINGKTLLMSIVHDITERKRTEHELLHAKAAAEAASIAKSQFLANMSHEIRTPMNGVIGLIELLLGTELTAEQLRYARLVKQSGRNLVDLISNILDLSKIEAHKIELEIRDFDLQTETIGTINLLSLQALEKGLELGFLIDADVPLSLKGDAGRLRQIITNLIGNAIKFTAKGSVSLRISKDAEDDQHTTLRFMVRDSGIGIAADKLETVFEAFTQADGSTNRNYGGTGLGLTISRQLAELMGGTVGIESTEGRGSTLWLTVVMEKQIVTTLPAPLIQVEGFETPAPAGGWSGRKSLCATGTRLLLVEDDPINQLVTKSILAKFGYRVDVANNGSEAIKTLENDVYALVLMDCMMPVMNGYEATAVIRDQTSKVINHAIPVIALTANAFKKDRDSCLAAGMDDYLSKPLDVSVLLAMLEKWVPLGSAHHGVAEIE